MFKKQLFITIIKKLTMISKLIINASVKPVIKKINVKKRKKNHIKNTLLNL